MSFFTEIPNDLRVPFFYAELDPSAAGSAATKPKSLVVAQKHPTLGSATVNVPVLVTSPIQADAIAGRGSPAAHMIKAYFKNDSIGEVWLLPIGDGTTAATGTFTVATDTADEDGVIYPYVGDRRFKVAVTSGQDQDAVAAAIAAAINADADGLVTAAAVLAVVTVTSRVKGASMNAIRLDIDRFGAAGNEPGVSGIAVTPEATLSGGAGDPSIETAVGNLADVEYDYVAYGFDVSDGTQRAFLTDELDARWGPLRMLYGHVWGADDDTIGNLSSLSINHPHFTAVGYNESPTPFFVVASAYMGATAKSLKNHPARPCQGIEVKGVMTPFDQDLFDTTDRNTLLYAGVATMSGNGRALFVERSITTYETNAASIPDTSFLDVQTLASLQFTQRFLKARVQSKFGRHILVDDGTPLLPSAAAISATPGMIRAELISAYVELATMGVVENVEWFKANLIVERDTVTNPATGDPNRVNVLFPPDLANQLRVVALLNQFRLQAPAVAA